MSDEKFFSLWTTGLRSLDYIKGIQNTGKKTTGTEIQVRYDKNVVIRPHYFNANDMKIRDRLNFGFFKNMSFEERLNYLKNQQTVEKEYLSDKKCELKFLSIGGEFLNLSAENQKKLMSNEWLKMEDVYNMFPRKPGSNANRHTLIFRGSVWMLTEHKEDIPNLYYNLIESRFSNTPIEGKMQVIKIGENKIGIVDNGDNRELFQNNEIFQNLKWMTPGILKSLLQKCIRFYSKNVIISGKVHSTIDVAIVTFLVLYHNSGSFVPNLQKFVKGSESAFKRLAVTILEDSSYNREFIISLLFASLVSRHDFTFSTHFLTLCCNCIFYSMNENYYVYNCHENERQVTSFEDYIIVESLKTLGSFETDIKMLNSICCNNWRIETKIQNRPEYMNIEHCIDQHCVTSVIHFFYVKNVYLEPSEIVKIMWNQSSKFNPRKHLINLNNDINLAQTRYWKFKTFEQKYEITESSNFIKLSRNIHESWITGMIGPMEHKIKNNIKVVSFFHSLDISSIVTIRAPSREKNEIELTDEDLLYCVDYISKLKSNPFLLKDETLGINNYFLFVNGKFIINIPEQGYSCDWKDYCNFEIEVKTFEIDNTDDFDIILDRIFSYDTDAIVIDWKERLTNILNDMKIEVLFRLAMYLRSVSKSISMYKISRDGTGTYLSVNWCDSVVFRFLCTCCYLAPVALKINKDSQGLDPEFKIKNISVWNHIKDLVFSKLNNIQLYDWGIRTNDTRQLRNHQQDAVDRIMDRVVSGKRGTILFMTVGSGKTKIITTSLFEIMKIKSLPKFVVYTLPPSANTSVIAEFELAGLPINLVNLHNTILKPFTINFINHDHLRNDSIKTQLRTLATDIFIIFDEFHLMMSMTTQRTSVALELSKICNGFIAMTGTLIKDGDHEPIIEWVSQVVDFELTPKNYLLGVAALISAKINFHIEERRTFVNVEIVDPDYFKNVSSNLGGTNDITNFQKAVDICYETIKYKIVEIGLYHLQNEQCIFVVALNKKMQDWLNQQFSSNGLNCFLVDGSNSINLTDDMDTNIRVVITTIRHSTGFTVTRAHTMISGVYFSALTTRQQMDGRILRLGQRSPFVNYIVVHTGLLSYTLNRYEDVRMTEKYIKDMIKEIE
jgi:superfamily II DNA or RNA helicase